MILMGFSYTELIIGILCSSLAILVLVIAYRKLLAYLGKGNPPKEKYCVLYPLEKNPASGELEFYFTTDEAKHVHFEILNADMSLNREISANDYESGGHILLFDSNLLENGTYFYQLRTSNQKTMKKMLVQN